MGEIMVKGDLSNSCLGNASSLLNYNFPYQHIH